MLSGAGVNAQPLVGRVQTNNLQTGPTTAATTSNNAATSSSAASNAGAGQSDGVVSGKTYQATSTTSPLTPYNQVRQKITPF